MQEVVSLAELLAESREDIADEWAERTRASSTRYSDEPPDEMRSDLMGLLDAMIHRLESGDSRRLDRIVTDISGRRAKEGFELSDTLAVISLGMRTAFDVLKTRCEDEDAPHWYEIADGLAEMFTHICLRHARVSEDLRRQSSVAEAVSDLAIAHQPIDERTVARRSVASIRDRFSLKSAVYLKCGDEDFFFSEEQGAVREALENACTMAAREGETVVTGPVDPFAPDAESVASVPIIARKEVIGAVAVASRDRSTLEDPGVRMIRSMADHIGVSCDKARLYQGAMNMVDSLEEGRSELFTILSALESAVYVADMETYELLAVNRKLEELFGPNLVGRKCYEVLQRGQTSPCPFCTNDRLMKENGTPAPPYSWKFENTRTGRTYSCVDRAIEWPDGRYVRLEIAYDITDLEEARMKTEKVRTLLQLYNDLLIHDLGNYIGSARGYMEVALESGDQGSSGDANLKTAHVQICRSGELIEKVRWFSKVYTSRDEARETKDLCSIVDEAIGDVCSSCQGEAAAVARDFGEGTRNVKVGAFSKEIFVNLLSNAVRYGGGGEVSARIEEADISGKPAWKVSISDHGPGIPPDKREDLFDRYMRLDSSKRFTGTGLGLSIAKTLTDRYGGRLIVGDRVPGDHSQGAEFSVVLPQA
ncbi:MAG: RsbRD N-terminal domain-containing protein [Methanobacteriota archaeon]|nr:MAG: RsbRD N-terminal domain-containing protein [Euryarchaeota archaeon]